MARSLAELDDYASGVLAEAEAEALESELFEAALRGEQPVSEYLHLRDGIAHLCERGTFGVTLTAEQAQRFRASGLDVQYVDVDADAGRTIKVPRARDVVLLRFGLDLRGVERIDIELLAGGRVAKTVDDVAFDAADNALYLVCEAELAIEAGRAGVVNRFVAVDGAQRRVLREWRSADLQVEIID